MYGPSNRHHPKTSDRLNEFAREYANQFESTIVHNAVYDAILGDEFAAELATIVFRIGNAVDRAEAIDADEIHGALFDARYDLDGDADVVRQRVEMVVAEKLEDLDDEIDEWDGSAWDDHEREAAQREIHHVQETGEVVA